MFPEIAAQFVGFTRPGSLSYTATNRWKVVIKQDGKYLTTKTSIRKGDARLSKGPTECTVADGQPPWPGPSQGRVSASLFMTQANRTETLWLRLSRDSFHGENANFTFE